MATRELEAVTPSHSPSLAARRRRGALFGFLTACVAVACSSSSGPAGGNANPLDDAAAEDAADSADGGDDLADASKRSEFGQPCPVGSDAACVEGLFCLEGPSGGAVGFCTKTCPKTSAAACPGAPAGTAAYCVVTDVNAQGDKGCAFVCRKGSKTYLCPGELKCQTTQEPAGSGQYLCLP